MAQATLKEFEEALKADEGLRHRYEEALKAVTEAANDGEAIQKAAASLGYELSLEELEQAWAAAQELDGAELDAVAGGQKEHDDWCWADYFCLAAAKHSNVPDGGNDVDPNCAKGYLTGHTEKCWSDYWCVLAWE